MSNRFTQTYIVAAGLADEEHLKEVNELAKHGYRVAHMLYAPSGEPNNKPIVVLMELTNAPEAQEYSR